MTDRSNDRLMSTAEVAGMLGMTEGGLRSWRYDRKGPRSFKQGRKVRYWESAVLEWLEEQEQLTGRGGVVTAVAS
jgi:predicted DNA-binding transcriptional regulator AlpA